MLDADSPFLTVNATLDWREPAHLMKLRFPVALENPEGTYEIPYGSLERPVDGAEEPGQAWVDLTGTIGGTPAGLTVVTTNKHGYDVSAAPDGGTPSIGITAVRSPVYSWHDPRLLSDESIYAYQDQGVQRFSYRLVPHAGDWRTAQPARMAALLGQPVRAQLESFHEGTLPSSFSFLSDGAGPVMVTAIKGSEDVSDGPGGADVVVRAVETTGAPARVTLDLPLVGRTLDLEFGPSQIRTFRIPADPTAEVVEVDLVEFPLASRPAGGAEAPGAPSARPAAPGGAVSEGETLTPAERLGTDETGRLPGDDE
jgi:alpha-mannosidase